MKRIIVALASLALAIAAPCSVWAATTAVNLDFEDADTYATGWTFSGTANEHKQGTRPDKTSKFLHLSVPNSTGTRESLAKYALPASVSGSAAYTIELDWFASMGFNNTTCYLRLMSGSTAIFSIEDPNVSSGSATTANVYGNPRGDAFGTFTSSGRGGNCEEDSDHWYHVTVSASVRSGVVLTVAKMDSTIVFGPTKVSAYLAPTELQARVESKSYSTTGGIDDLTIVASEDVTWDDSVASGDWNTTGVNWTGKTADDTVWSASAAIKDNAVIGDETVTVVDDVAAGNVTIANGSITVSDGKSLTLDGTLAKTGTGTIEGNVSATNVALGYGLVDAKSPADSSIDLSFTTTPALYGDTVALANGYHAAYKVNQDVTITSLSGQGRVESTGAVTVNAADGENTLFTGAISGSSFTKSGEGTLRILGANTLGSTSITGGTLILASPTDLSNVSYDLDASRADTLIPDPDDQESIYKWTDSLGGSHYVITNAVTTGNNSQHSRSSANPTISTSYFGGRPSLVSDTFRMVHNGAENQSSVFAVFQFTDTHTWQRVLEDDGDAYYGWRWRVQSNGSGVFGRYPNTNTAEDGSYIDTTAAANQPTVLSVPFWWPRDDRGNRNIAYGCGNKMAWAEILSFTRQVTVEEKDAITAYLMGKWGIAAYQPLGTGAVTVGANGTLDANNVYATIASLNLLGTLANATNLTVSGAATFSAGATIEVALPGDAAVGTKILSCGSASGLENLTVKVNGVALTGLKPKFNTEGIYLRRDGFVITIASADVTIDENDSFNSWLSSNDYDISTESGITAVQTALVTKNETTGMSPLEAYVLGYDDKGATPNIAAISTATGFTLTFDSHTPNALSGIDVTYSVQKSSDNSVWSDATTTPAGSGAVSLAFDDAGLYNKLVATIAAAGE